MNMDDWIEQCAEKFLSSDIAERMSATDVIGRLNADADFAAQGYSNGSIRSRLSVVSADPARRVIRAAGSWGYYLQAALGSGRSDSTAPVVQAVTARSTSLSVGAVVPSITPITNGNREGQMPTFMPLVTSATTAQSLNVATIMGSMRRGKYKIPSYQRDAAEWSDEKRSLFIESVINNLTVPPILVYPEDDSAGIEVRQVIDGQQRLTTLDSFMRDQFKLASENDVEYAENVGAQIQGKHFSELPPDIQEQIRDYVINLIVLPKNLDLSLRLLIFRRINEEGVPLSAHDLRLASFGDCARVSLIRLAGIREPAGTAGARMIAAAEGHGVVFPWKDHQPWAAWWGDSRQAVGQAPSEMFLYYVIARMLAERPRRAYDALMTQKTRDTVRIRYDRTTTSVLDLFCAQALYESSGENRAVFLPTLSVVQRWFADFELWFNTIKTAKIPSLTVSSARKVALFIAAAAEAFKSPDGMTERQWRLTSEFLTSGPKDIEDKFKIKYPIAKGKWPGQLQQVDATFQICEEIERRG